jgi:hypothetical protein
MIVMHSHMTTHLVTAMRIEAELAAPRARRTRAPRTRPTLHLPHRSAAARRAIRPA